MHEDDKLEGLKFGMKIRNTAKSAFERQVGESVLIQQEVSRHRILNSKSEYNRCALPRLTTKLGAEEFEEWKKELKEEKLKEEDLKKKIRVLRKQRNKNRNAIINIQHLPPTKKRKISTEKYKSVRQIFLNIEEKMKRERDLVEDGKETKKRKVEEKINLSKEEDQLTVGETIPTSEDDTDGRDIVDWEAEIKRHGEDIERKEETRKEGENTCDLSWDLLNNCVDYLRENEES